MPRVAIILINYKDYAEKYLEECIESLRKQSYPKDSFKVFIVDNETSPETLGFLKKTAPEAEIIPSQKNNGFAEGNNIAIRKAISENYDYVVLLNMDTIVSSEWLLELVKTSQLTHIHDREYESIGAVQSLIMLHPETDKINSIGNQMHFLGFGFCQSYGELMSNIQYPISNRFFYASGASVLYPVKVLREVGIFDPEFFMYHEDTDLSWRMRQAGYRILLAPKSIAYHKYQFSRSITQFYYIERNRMIMMFENYKLGTLILILPAFLAMEIGQLFYTMFRGLLLAKLKVYGYFLRPKNLLRMIKNKKRKAKLRKVKDRELAKLIVGKIEFQEIANPVLKYIANPIFSVYWKILRNLIFW